MARAQAALNHAEAHLAYQQAQAQLSTAGALRHHHRRALAAHARAADRHNRLSTEAGAAALQAGECAARAHESCALGRLQDASAMQFAALRAQQRAADLGADADAHAAAARAAALAGNALTAMDEQTSVLKEAVSAAGRVLLNHHHASAKEAAGGGGASSVVPAVAAVCRHSAEATAARHAAARALVGAQRAAERAGAARAPCAAWGREVRGWEAAAGHAAERRLPTALQQLAGLLEGAPPHLFVPRFPFRRIADRTLTQALICMRVPPCRAGGGGAAGGPGAAGRGMRLRRSITPSRRRDTVRGRGGGAHG